MNCTGGRLATCILAISIFVSASVEVSAQQTTEAPTQLPPVEVVTKQAAAPKKKKRQASQVKAAPKAAAAAATPGQPTDAAPQQAPPSSNGKATASSATPVEDYVAKDSALGTKTDTPIKETPQSISVVGKEQMRDQGVQNLQEAVRYVPGVLADGFGYDSRGDYAIIRGIPAAYFIDGLRTNYGYYVNSIAVEPYALERVEVLRGPASMLYGQVPTGGIINGTSKLPLDIPYREIGVEYGSFDFKQVKVDMSGPLTSDGKWLYRVVGLARDSDTQVDFVANDRLMLAPSLTYRPTKDTSITVLGNFRDDHSGSSQQFLPQVGTLTPNVNGQRASHSTFVGEPDDYYDTEARSGTLLFDHKFSEYLSLHHGTRYAYTDNAYESSYGAILTPTRFNVLNQLLGNALDPTNAPFLNAGQSEIARAHLLQFSETEIFNSDTNLTGKFMTGGIAHKVTGGVDYMRFSTDLLTSGTLVDNLSPIGQPVFDIYNPQYGLSNFYLSLGGGPVPADAVPLEARPHEVQSQAGLYIQDQIKMGPWIAVLGLRQDWLKVEQAGQEDEHDTATTGRAALMYAFDSGMTPYVSYSTSFTPLPGQPVGNHIFASTFGETLKAAGPIEGEQVEVGFKYQPNGLPFMINAALYELTDKNQIVQPDFIFDAVQGADVKARGFEIELIGKVTPEIKVIASYSYTDAKFDKYPELYVGGSDISDFMQGKPFDGIPKHLASLWAIYSVQDGPLRGLSFGGGVRYVGGSESFGREIAFGPGGLPVAGSEIYVKTPSHTLFDAMVAYETEDWRWQLTAQNLENEFYVVGCTAYRGDCGVGQARTIITGLTYKF